MGKENGPRDENAVRGDRATDCGPRGEACACGGGGNQGGSEADAGRAWVAPFKRYFSEVEAKLGWAADRYSDDAFYRPAPETAEEIISEIVDLAGWGTILYYRARKLQESLEDLELRERVAMRALEDSLSDLDDVEEQLAGRREVAEKLDRVLREIQEKLQGKDGDNGKA